MNKNKFQVEQFDPRITEWEPILHTSSLDEANLALRNGEGEKRRLMVEIDRVE